MISETIAHPSLIRNIFLCQPKTLLFATDSQLILQIGNAMDQCFTAGLLVSCDSPSVRSSLSGGRINYNYRTIVAMSMQAGKQATKALRYMGRYPCADAMDGSLCPDMVHGKQVT